MGNYNNHDDDNSDEETNLNNNNIDKILTPKKVKKDKKKVSKKESKIDDDESMFESDDDQGKKKYTMGDLERDIKGADEFEDIFSIDENEDNPEEEEEEKIYPDDKNINENKILPPESETNFVLYGTKHFYTFLRFLYIIY